MVRASKHHAFLEALLNFLRGKPRKSGTAAARRGAGRGMQGDRPSSAPAGPHPYRGAEIVGNAGACAAAAALAHKRFLQAEVPRLPLAGCTSHKCTCTYLRYQDRRNGSAARRAEFSLQTRLYAAQGNTERRVRIDRRAASAQADADFDYGRWH